MPTFSPVIQYDKPLAFQYFPKHRGDPAFLLAGPEMRFGNMIMWPLAQQNAVAVAHDPSARGIELVASVCSFPRDPAFHVGARRWSLPRSDSVVSPLRPVHEIRAGFRPMRRFPQLVRWNYCVYPGAQHSHAGLFPIYTNLILNAATERVGLVTSKNEEMRCDDSISLYTCRSKSKGCGGRVLAMNTVTCMGSTEYLTGRSSWDDIIHSGGWLRKGRLPIMI